MRPLWALAGLVLSSAAWAQEGAEMAVVEQVSDPFAAVARNMFRFEPPILVLEEEDTVAFLNSVASHTVTTQAGLWPEGVPTINIRGQARAEVTFDEPGLYGITCARHGRYGMTMLIAVVDKGLAAAATLDPSSLRASSLAKESFAEQARALMAHSN